MPEPITVVSMMISLPENRFPQIEAIIQKFRAEGWRVQRKPGSNDYIITWREP
ncbi:MAG: hypothetical protein JOZ87_06040 [Chloroflexi bacterium]|nr:hypothetical protein [Chloroflexota bacterium]